MVEIVHVNIDLLIERRSCIQERGLTIEIRAGFENSRREYITLLQILLTVSVFQDRTNEIIMQREQTYF